MRGIYVGLLRLYPAEYQAIFSREMAATFDEAASDRRQRGWFALVRFAVCESFGLLKGLASEWLAKSHGREEYLMPRPEIKDSMDVATIQKFLEQTIRRMEFAIARHDFPTARFHSEAERITRARLQASLQMRRSDG